MPEDNSSGEEKGVKMNEFTEFFGLNVLNRTLPETETIDDINTQLKSESFVYIMNHLNGVKDGYLNKVEGLKLGVLEDIGKLNEFEATIGAGAGEMKDEVKHDSLFTTIDFGKPIQQLEEMMNLEFEFSNVEIIDLIGKYSMLIEFENSEYKKYKEQLLELKVCKIQVDGLYQSFGLPKMQEPVEKSISKVAMFMELLEELFNSCLNAIVQLLKDRVEHFKTLIDENVKNFRKSCSILKQDIITISETVEKEKRLVEYNKLLKDLNDLKKLHLFIIYNVKKLESIFNSCGGGIGGRGIGEFNKMTYLKIIIDNKNEWIFINDLVNDCIRHLDSTLTQVRDFKSMLNIFEFMDVHEKDLSTYQTNLLMHKLIRFEYKIHLNPINEIFHKFDVNNKGFLTKSEFQKIFKLIFPNNKNYDLNEIDTIFETNYEVIGKIRRGMEFKQFRTIVELSEFENDFSDAKVDELYEGYKVERGDDNAVVDMVINLRSDGFKAAIMKNQALVCKIFPDGGISKWFDGGRSENVCIFRDSEGGEVGDDRKDGAEEFIEFVKTLENVDLSKI